MKELSIAEVAEKLGVSQDTLRNWDASGKLKPYRITDGGHRRYNEEDILRIEMDTKTEVIEYGSPKNEDLAQLMERLKEAVIVVSRPEQLRDYSRRIATLISHLKSWMQCLQAYSNPVIVISQLSGTLPLSYKLPDDYELLDNHTTTGVSIVVNQSKLSAIIKFVFAAKKTNCCLLALTEFTNVPNHFVPPIAKWKQLITFNPDKSLSVSSDVKRLFDSVVGDAVRTLIDMASRRTHDQD